VEEIFLCGDGASSLKKGLEIIPQATFILNRFHLEKRIREALPQDGSGEELWEATERGFLGGSGGLLPQNPFRKKSSRERRRLEDLSTYLSQKLKRESRTPGTTRLRSVLKLM